MSDPLQVFNKWCDEFPSYLVANNMNLMNNLIYFDQVLDYYRAHFILCEPYQQFTIKFMTITVPNALSKLLAFSTLEPQIYNKVIFLLAKYIDLPAQLIIKNILFYKQFSFIPDDIFSKETNFMKSNNRAQTDLQQLVKEYPYSVIKEWMQKSPAIDWNIFHFIINYVFFIIHYISPEEFLNIFYPLFTKLFDQTVSGIQNINQSTFANDIYILLLLSSETKYNQMLPDVIIKLIIVFIKISSDVDFTSSLIIRLAAIQKDEKFNLKVKKILNECEFDKFLINPKTPLAIIKKCCFGVLMLDKSMVLKIFVEILSLSGDQADRFSSIFINCNLSFQNLSVPEKIDIFNAIMKEKASHNQMIELIFMVQSLKEKEIFPIPFVDQLIEFCFHDITYITSLLNQKIKNNNFASRILYYLIEHSDESEIKLLFNNFSKGNPTCFSLIKYDTYHQVLLKNNNNSFLFYFRCILLGRFKITEESMKVIWDQMLQNKQRTQIFQVFLELGGLSLFYKESFHYFKDSLLAQDMSKLNQQMVDLIVDLVYIQDKQKDDMIDKSIRITSFNHFGMNELFKCYLDSQDDEIFNYVKTQLLIMWNNCDIKISSERNEALSEIMIKNSKNESQFIRCFDFLYDFVKSGLIIYLLEDFGYSHLKSQKEILQKKSLKLIIELIKTKPTQNDKDNGIHREVMNFSPSDLCSTLITRVTMKFKCNKISNAKCYGKTLNPNSTLEMNRITNGSVIQLEYDFINVKFENFKYLEIFMPQMIMYCAPIYQKGIDLLHSDHLSSNLAESILRFIYFLPISSQLESFLDTNDVISRAINDSLNIYERELFLRVLFKSIDEIPVKNMLVQNHFHKTLIDVFIEKELNNAGRKLTLSILIEIWPENEDDEFINNQLHKFINKIIGLMMDKDIKSRRFIDICADTLIKISQFDSYQQIMNNEIKANIMNIISNIQWEIFGKIISQLKNKNEIYNILIPHLDEFTSNEERSPYYFDAIFSSVGDENQNVKEISEFAITHLCNCKKSVFGSLCKFIIARPELYSQIDIQRFFNYIEENEVDAHIFKLIYEIYQKVPEKQNDISKVISKYISIELPEYNINENYVLKKSPLGSGIRNLSNTCYINSALQLLFNIKSFRTSMITKENFSEDWQKNLQTFFAVKEFGLLPIVDPSDFVNNYKMMGVKINISEQQDAAEFLLSIIDGLPNDLSSLFCGSLTNTFSGIDYPYTSSNSEKFNCLSLDVDGCESLEVSLNRFQMPEIVDDYKVQDRKESITVKKTTAIQKLPKVLLIQLRRFIFNFKTASKEKLNSYFAFPLSIDMSNYSFIQNEEKYMLMGFILHSGNADCGHFHYVGYNKMTNQWIDYNDSITFPYEISNLEKDAFGSNSVKGNDNNAMLSNQSAYILMYVKIEDDMANDELKEQDISAHLREAIKAEKIKSKRISCVMSDDFYNLAMNSNDVKFLYYYFTKAMLHMNKVDKCTAVKDRLQNLIKGNKWKMQQVIELIENDKISTVTPIIYIRNDLIIQVWIDFLKFVIRNSENGESYCFVTTFINCIDIFKENINQAKYFAEIGKEILEFPDSLIIAQSQEWNLKFVLVLATLIQKIMNDDSFNPAGIDFFFEDLILMSPIIEKQQIDLVNQFNPFVKMLSPKTQKLYKDLLTALSYNK